MQIADLHCDLLTYLAKDPLRKRDDRASRCSIPLLIEGNVKYQTLAIFTEEGADSHEEAKKQAEIFCKLAIPAISFTPAIENASAILLENEPITLLEQRLDFFLKTLGQIFYISLTWNGENRFGGGAFEQKVGLKSDGKELLRLLHGKKIAIDLSHASDRLGFDILSFIDQENIDVPVIASHSNCRYIHNQLRNLPDELISEIIQRNGLIGLNFVRHFIDDESFEKIGDHAEHILSLGGSKVLALGSDFFAAEDLPIERYKLHHSWYFDEFDNSSCLPNALKIIEKSVGSAIERIACQNILDYRRKLWEK